MWLKQLRKRAEQAEGTTIVVTPSELREIVTGCGVQDRRLRALAERDGGDDMTIKARTVLELIRACRHERACELRGCRR